jgi:hypothetical protein
MTATVRLGIADLAQLAYRNATTEAEQQGDEMFDQHREEFFACARKCARSALGEEAAAQLAWVYTGTADLPADTEEATALLDESHTEYLRYRHSDTDVTFELVQPCGSCGHQRINAVHNLVQLGALLTETTS